MPSTKVSEQDARDMAAYLWPKLSGSPKGSMANTQTRRADFDVDHRALTGNFAACRCVGVREVECYPFAHSFRTQRALPSMLQTRRSPLIPVSFPSIRNAACNGHYQLLLQCKRSSK
jgi:hypothetical protein